MRVSSLMTRQPVTCRPGDSDSQAASVMWENDCGVVPVVDDDSRLVGIATDRDLCMGAYTKGRPLGEMRVADSMSDDVQACREDDELHRALEVMGERKLRRLPVVDEEGRLVGILSLNDAFRHAAGLKGAKEKQALVNRLVETMASICEPRRATIPIG